MSGRNKWPPPGLTDTTEERLGECAICGREDSHGVRECADTLGERLSRVERELELRKSFMDRLPLCPDHRDKVAGSPCLKCLVEERDVRLSRVEKERDRYRGALEEIAMYEDEGANATLERTGSYGSFDHPGSVKVARRALREE